jgi:hypothetical protein
MVIGSQEAAGWLFYAKCQGCYLTITYKRLRAPLVSNEIYALLLYFPRSPNTRLPLSPGRVNQRRQSQLRTRSHMDLLATVKLEFASLALRSSQPPPVGVLPNSMVLAPQSKDNNDKAAKVIESHFENLSRRLGEHWTWDKDENGYILFQKGSFSTANEAFKFSAQHVSEFEEVSWGAMDQSVKFKDVTQKKRRKDTSQEDKTCAICLREVSARSLVIVLGCGHWFEEECIKQWIRIDESCPNCRQDLVRSAVGRG